MELGIWETSSTPFFRSSTKSSFKLIPDLLGALRRGRKEGFVSLVGFVVLLDEVANIDLLCQRPVLNPCQGDCVSAESFGV